MKKRNLMIALLCVVTLINTGCKKDKQPVAEISADKTTVERGEIVTFTNTSQDAASYEWYFGDGTESTEKSPKKSWSSDGTYVAQLKAFSKRKKNIDVASIIITVSAANAKFIGTYSVSEVYTSDNCGSGPYSYSMSIYEGATGGQVVINNFADVFDDVKGNISGNTLTIPTQYLVMDINSFYWDISALGSSTGTVDGNLLTMSYNIDDISYDNNCGELTANLTAVK